MARFAPADAPALRDIVAWAAGEEQPLELIGNGSKRALGRPLQVEHTVDLGAFAGIIDYEAAELVLTAGAATPLAAIETALAAQSQMLAFEPPDWTALIDAPSGQAIAGQTIGGVLACNLAGPRRFKAGAARDHFLGFQAVSGRGEIFKAGGKVVKNVTGYDLSKLMAGSWGTLAALTEVSVKVLPRPERTRTILILGLDDARAVAAMAEALNAPHEVSGAAHIPTALAARSAVSYIAGAGATVTALRVEGPGPSVEHRCDALRRELAAYGPTEELHSANSLALWREVGDAAWLAAESGDILWRLSLPPSAAPALLRALAGQIEVRHFLDWGGGLVWLAIAAGSDSNSDAGDGGAAIIRAALASSGGHATLIRAPPALRAAVAVFEPQEGALGALAARVKDSFDPRRILNPGRMVRGL
jgi:glycolate oxidase FAD binding subunit